MSEQTREESKNEGKPAGGKRTLSRRRFLRLVGATVAGTALAAAGLGCGQSPTPPPGEQQGATPTQPPSPTEVPAELNSDGDALKENEWLREVEIIPEPQRQMERLVINPLPFSELQPKLFTDENLPDGSGDEKNQLLTLLYGINLELNYGAIFSLIPSYTKIFVGKSEIFGSKQEQFFRDWLAQKYGWERTRIENNISFVSLPDYGQAPWTQDWAEVAGNDREGKTVLLTSSSYPERGYKEMIRLLIDAFPQEFRFASLDVELPDGTKFTYATGGDTEFSVSPEGKPIFICGKKTFGELYERFFGPIPFAQDKIDTLKNQLGQSLGNMEVMVVCERYLLEKQTAGESDIFHWDMGGLILDNGNGPIAYVPEEVSGGWASFMEELTWIKEQLESRGYPVRRLPFVGPMIYYGPANCVRFQNRETGQPTVWLPLSPSFDDYATLLQEQEAFSGLTEAWKNDPSPVNFQGLKEYLEGLKQRVETVPQDPFYSQQIQVLEQDGFAVFPIAAWGLSGGRIHCKTLAEIYSKKAASV